MNPWTNTTLLTQVQQGLAGGYAQNLIINGLRGSVVFQQNPNIFITELLQNAARFNYNALQAEVRRRFKNGLSFQANYTFQKTLTDLPFEDQNRQGETQESNNPELNYGRSDFDRTHVFNANMIFELPFGKGKQYLNSGGWMNALVGGWQFTSIVNLESGAPDRNRRSAWNKVDHVQVGTPIGIFDSHRFADKGPDRHFQNAERCLFYEPERLERDHHKHHDRRGPAGL